MTDKEIRSGEAAIVQKQAEEALAGSEALLSEAQEVSRVGGNVIDITKFKRMEISLQEARKMAERYLSVAAEVILGLDAQGNITLLNDSGHRLLGYAPGELIGKNWFDTCLPEEARTEVHGIFAKLMDGEYADVLTYENSIITRSGNRLDLLWHNTLLRDTNGRIAGALSSAEDITERKRAEDKLRVAQLQWSQFLAASPDAMWIKDASGRYVAASKTYFHLDPSAEGNIIGKTDAECFPPEKATVYVADDRIAIETGASEGEFTAVGDDGKLRTFLTKKVVLRAPDGSVAGTLGVSRDITDRKQAEEEIQRERVFFDRLVETAPEGIAITDTQGRVMRVNTEFMRMFGYGVDEAVGQFIDDLVAPPARQEEAKAMTISVGQGETNFLETVRRRKDGSFIDVSIIAAPVLIAGKQVANYAIYRDITERKQLEQKLEEVATHDSLTGLPNRRLLLDRFTVAAALAHRNKSRLVVMSLDVDKFKSINDTLGHDAGDQVLKVIGTRLTGTVRAIDTLARVGGDEFISVMMVTGHMEGTNAIAQKILDSFAEPLSIAGHELHLSTSIGIAIYPEDAEDLETLTKKSDAAMYYSKDHGRNQFKFYGDGDVRIG